jgi:DMSO/TMAO reductase YedYZ molybdopterin-dependent catalytic subunit
VSEERHGKLGRRGFLARLGALGSVFALGGCNDINQTQWLPNFLDSAEHLSKWAQRLFAGSHALAPEFEKSDIAPTFRANGTLDPGTDEYATLFNNGFKDWRLTVEGLVEHPLSLTLDQLRAMPARSQITRHDCVEGWSVIGEWKGPQLAHVLAMAKPKPAARYAVFYCMDPMADQYTDNIEAAPFYYETLDLLEATHPQTILAYELNGQTLPKENGAPVRVRAERQLGYKQAKYVERIVLVENYAHIQGGKGGYWEDQGYTAWGGI